MKIKRIIASILSISSIFCFCSCTSCKSADGGDGKNDGKDSNATILVDGLTEHYVSNTLHKVSVKETNKPFIQNSQTNYVIVVGESEEAKTAAAFIQNKLYEATGCVVSIVEDSSVAWEQSSNYIVVGSNDLFTTAGLSMPQDNLGNAGYYIKTIGNSVFIACKNVRGYQHGAIAFLRETVGYDMIAYDTIVYEKNGATLPDMEIIEAPDFETAANNLSYGSDSYFYGMGQVRASDSWVVPEDGGFIHNSFKYLSPDVYYSEHEEWYSEGKYQLCYTAGGDETELNQMVEIVAGKMKEALDENPGLNDISISIQDNLYSCTCDACKIEYDKYGTDSAAVIKFVNRVAEKLDSWYEHEATENGTEKRDFYVAFLAYNKYVKPPVKEENGKYVEIDSTVKCNDNVGVWIAPIGAQYNRSFYDLENESTAKTVEGWASLTDRMYFWLYQTNFRCFLYPYNNFESVIETYRFCKHYGAVYMYNQSQSRQGVSSDAMTGFHIFKLYLSKCAMFDVNVDYKTCLDKFFKYYYGDAAEVMREFYDELMIWLKYLEGTYAEFRNGSIYARYDNEKAQSFYPKKKLDHWLDIIDEAYDAIEKYKVTNKELYDKLSAHINKESIFPRYVLVTIYSGMYTGSELYNMRKEFKEDCISLGINCYEEDEYLAVKYSEWGV